MISDLCIVEMQDSQRFAGRDRRHSAIAYRLVPQPEPKQLPAQRLQQDNVFIRDIPGIDKIS